MKKISETARLIWNIIMNARNITLSWGIDLDTIESDELSLRFHVQGFLHTGTVEVRLNEGADLFEISLLDESGNLTEKLEEIYIDQLVDVIDRHVENDQSGNYETLVDNWLREEHVSEVIIFA